MNDITEYVGRYREAVRHLWNTSFHAAAVDWDARDSFSRVASELFNALVLEPTGSTEQRLPEMFDPAPAHFRHIAVTPVANQIPIHVNREAKSSGYWDDPVNVLGAGEAEVRFVRFFDWDELAPRDFQYALVRIIAWPAHQHLVDRFALLECGYVRFMLLASGSA